MIDNYDAEKLSEIVKCKGVMTLFLRLDLTINVY